MIAQTVQIITERTQSPELLSPAWQVTTLAAGVFALAIIWLWLTHGKR